MAEQLATLGDPAAQEPEPTKDPQPGIEPDELQDSEGAAPEGEAEPTGEGEEPEGEEPEGEPEADEGAGDEDLVDVEYEGQTYSVPPNLKDALLRQADYTRKTQETAAQRRELEQQAEALKAHQEALQQQSQAQRQNLKDYARLETVEGQIEELQKTNWDELAEEDSAEAQRRATQLTVLTNERNGLADKLRKSEQEAFEKQRAEHARRIEQAQAEVARTIPNWSNETATKVSETGRRIGYSDRELYAANADPRAVRALYLASLGEQVEKQQRAAVRPKKQPVKPAPKVSTGGPPASGPRDDQDINAWIEARNRQLAKRRSG